MYVWKCIFGLLQFLTCTKKVCFVLYEEGWVSVLLTLSTKITQCQVVSKLLQANNTRIQTFLYSDQDKNGFAAGALKFNMWLHAHYRCSYSLWWWSRSWCISQSWQFSVPRCHFMVTYHLKGTAMDTGIIIFSTIPSPINELVKFHDLFLKLSQNPIFNWVDVLDIFSQYLIFRRSCFHLASQLCNMPQHPRCDLTEQERIWIHTETTWPQLPFSMRSDLCVCLCLCIFSCSLVFLYKFLRFLLEGKILQKISLFSFIFFCFIILLTFYLIIIRCF